uniref:Uncharacterized protein n=1 Tax=Octopus bimaculoides TaxID=37653 RepID=A0A0L8I1H5_OCTBM
MMWVGHPSLHHPHNHSQSLHPLPTPSCHYNLHLKRHPRFIPSMPLCCCNNGNHDDHHHYFCHLYHHQLCHNHRHYHHRHHHHGHYHNLYIHHYCCPNLIGTKELDMTCFVKSARNTNPSILKNDKKRNDLLNEDLPRTKRP